jgi:centrosomal protein CEP104
LIRSSFKVGKLYHRNHARREEALEEIYQILSSFSGDQEDARAYLRAGSFVVARMFRVDVLAIFSHSLKLFHLLMNDYVRRHSIQKQDIIASLERVLPVLLQRTGDSNARLRQKAQEAIIESASYPELKPLHVIPHYCVSPFNKTCAPRLAISRCELIEELMKILDVKAGDNGITVDNVSKFCALALEHNAGEVREIAIKLLISLYKV